MCQVTPPPTLFLVGPLQAPTTWLLVTGTLVLLAVLGVLAYQRYVRTVTHGALAVVWLALYTGSSLAVLTFMVIYNQVVFPAQTAWLAWENAQIHTFIAHHCPTATYRALDATAQHLWNGDIVTWQGVGDVLANVGPSGLFVSVVWLIWLYGRHRRDASALTQHRHIA